MNEFMQKVNTFFIHPKLNSNIEEHGRAKILLYAMLITTAFASTYSIYYELTHDKIHLVKHLANYLGILTGPIGLVLLKNVSSLKKIILSELIIAITLVFTSTFFSGGIYSVDLLWMVVITMIAFLFVDNRGGVFSLALSVIYFIIFYVMEYNGLHDFKGENMELGVGYNLYNYIFILGLASCITYFFVIGVNKIKAELDELKEQQVKSLDYKYQYITENANEIIALHTHDGAATYISPAIKSILGYEAKEMHGLQYKTLLGGDLSNKEIVCQHQTGKQVWLSLSFKSIHDELGTGEVYISMARDISEKVQENEKMNYLRKQIANDFHDEMGNKLSAITLNSSVLSAHLQNKPAYRDTIKKIEETSKSLYQNSRDFIWSIDSKSDDLREIFSYLRDFGEDFFHSLSVNFLVDSDNFSAQQKITLPIYSGRHIILIFKEALTNAAKHAHCSAITLSLRVNKSTFEISVSDNGKGIDANSKLSKGILSMKDRAQTIDAELSIESSEKGTKISLIGKIPTHINSIAV